MRTKMEEKIAILMAISVLLVGSNSRAEEEKTARVYDLGEVVVTATRTQSYQSEVGSATTVISAEDLEKTGPAAISEVLRNVPGVSMAQSGALGGLTDIYIWGSKPGHTLVLIDGVEVNDPMKTDRSFDFGHLTTDNIERIEIVRGPQSTLYGSDAMAGVVNIITKKGKGRPTFKVLSECGAHNTFRENISLSGSTEQADYSFSASRIDSEGISKAVDGSEKDGYRNTAFSSKIDYRILEDSKLGVVLRYTDSRAELDDGAYEDDPNNIAWWRNLATRISLNQTINSWWEHSPAFSYSNTSRQYRDEPDSADPADKTHNWFEGDNKKIEWQHIFYPVNWSTLTGGLEYEEETGFGDGRAASNRFDRKSLDNKSCYLQNQFKLKECLFITPGLRIDNHQYFGTETTYRISTAWLISQTLTRLKANYGTGFKAPSLYQLYSTYGSTDLEPDESKSYDMGFEQSFFNDRANLGLTWFHNGFKNTIEWDSSTSKYKNIGQSETEGLEIETRFLAGPDITITNGFSYLDTRNKETGKELKRRPGHQANMAVNWAFLDKKGNLNLSTNYAGFRWDNDTNTQKVKAYTKADLFASYNITESFQVFGSIKNLFDRTYQENRGYAAEGRSFYTGVKVSF